MTGKFILANMTKKHILILILWFVYSSISASDKDYLNYILNTKTVFVNQYQIDSHQINKLLLEVSFSNYTILNPDDINKLKNKTIESIELVYTTYKESETFKQSELNKSRILELKRIAPFIFENNLISWKIIAQTKDTVSSEVKKLFHGFVITYREKISTENEIKYIYSMLEGKSVSLYDTASVALEFSSSSMSKKTETTTKATETSKSKSKTKSKGKTHSEDTKTLKEIKYRNYRDTATAVYTNPDSTTSRYASIIVNFNYPRFLGGDKAFEKYVKDNFKLTRQERINYTGKTINICFDIDKYGRIRKVELRKGIEESVDAKAVTLITNMPNWIPGDVNRRTKSFRACVNINIEKKPVTEIGFTNLKKDENVVEIIPSLSSIDDKAIRQKLDSTIFRALNDNPNWKNILLICDLTGSMSPYTVQLLKWIKTNINSKTNIKKIVFFNDGNNKPDINKELGNTGGIYATNNIAYENVLKLAEQTMRSGDGGDISENNIEAIIEGLKNCTNCEDVIMIADNLATPRDLSLFTTINKRVNFILCGTDGGINPIYLSLARALKGSVHTANTDVTNLLQIKEGEQITIDGYGYELKKNRFLRVWK